MLQVLLPAKRFVREGHLFEKHVSSEPSTRQEVVELQADLERKLKQLHARESGLCSIREAVFEELFDELIREIAVNQPERGIMLLRIREELRMRIASYQTLFDSAVVFSSRKQLESEEGVSLEEEVLTVNRSKRDELRAEVANLRYDIDKAEKRASEKRTLLARKRAEELDYIKSQGAHLETFLKDLERQQAQAAQN